MKCPECQFHNPEGIKFCGVCGARLEKQEKATGSERKHVTIVFTDLSGYTAMTERLDPEDVRSVLGSVFKKIARIVEGYDGFIERYIGDSVMAVFGIPRTHEDDPVRAVHAALQIHEAVNRMNAWISRKTGCAICMHTGINTGLVLTGNVNSKDGSHGLTGLDLNIAARLEGIARDDEIIVGLSTYELTKNMFAFKELKPVKVKGRSGLLRIFKVLSKKSYAPPATKLSWVKTVFVGREKELQILGEALDQVITKGEGRVFSIAGDPGIGKSRLVTEHKKLFEGHDLLWISSQSTSFAQHTSYGTFLDLLKNFAHIKDTDDNVKSWDKLETKLRQLVPEEVANTLPYLATILSIHIRKNFDHKVQFLDAETLKMQIFRAFYLLVKSLVRKRPLVLEFEDFHWTDDSTVALLVHLLPLVQDESLELIFVCRNIKNNPLYKLEKIFTETGGKHYTRIDLDPLSKKDVVDFTMQRLNLDGISSQLSGLIHRKTEGNPLYMEGLIHTLISQDLLEKDSITGQHTLKPVSGKIQIPDTLRGLVASSVDKLDKHSKDVLKKASVIGRSFLYRLLKSIEGESDVLDAHLSVLINENLIKEKCADPELEYYFYHDLIKDAVYETILLKERKELHRKVAEAIEILFTDQIETFYSLLSYHFAKASDWNKARRYFALAGDQAGKIAGDSEALAHYKKAVSAHEEIFGDQLKDFDKAVYTRKLAEIYFRRGEHDKALESYKKAFLLLGVSYPFTVWKTRTAIVKQIGRQCFHRAMFCFLITRAGSKKTSEYDREVARIFESMAWIDLFINQERLALDILSLLNFAEKTHNTTKRLQAYAGFGFLLDTLGFYTVAGYYHDLFTRISGPATDDHTLAYASLCRAVHLDYTGHWNQALVLYEKAARIFEEIGHIKKWGSSVSLMIFIYNNQGEFGKSRYFARELIKIGVESGDRQLKGWGIGGGGFYKMRMGMFDEVAKDLNQAKKLLESIPDYHALVQAHIDLMAVYLHLENYDRAFTAIKRAENLVIKKHLKGFVQSLLYNAVCEFHLTMLGISNPLGKKFIFKKSKKYLGTALHYGNRFKCGLPKAYRLNGRFYSIKGNRKKACDFWHQGIKTAQGLGAKFEEGLICFEMGRCLQDIAYLERAREIFHTLNAQTELSKVQAQIEILEKDVLPDLLMAGKSGF